MIEIANVTTGTLVVFAGADWTDDERRMAVAQVMRLAGLPDRECFTEAAKLKGSG